MSKSGSRYGRRSNWFKIHYLMNNGNDSTSPTQQSSVGENDFPMTEVPSTTASNLNLSSPSTLISNLNSPRSDQTHIPSDFKFNSDFKFTNDFRLCPDMPRLPGLPDLRQIKSNPELRLSDIKPPLDLKLHESFGLDFKALNSPTPSSSESHNSDSSQDLGEKNPFSAYNESQCPKDIFGLYNLPTLTPRIPSYMAPSSIAQRCLYPFYPSLLSVYSRQQYVDKLISQARQAGTTNVVPTSSEGVRDIPSPRREIPPPPKLFKPDTEHLLNICRDAINQCEKSALEMFPIMPIRPASNSDSDKLVIPTSNSPVRSKSAGNVEISENESELQESPIDLSVRIKTESPHSSCDDRSTHSVSPDSNTVEDVPSEDRGISSPNEADTIIKKEEQQIPLDLSAIRT